MIQVKIKNVASQQYTHGAQFESNELAQKWVAAHIAKGTNCPFGKIERLVPISECSQAELDSALEIIPEIVDGDVFISPAKARLPQEFTVEIVDISAQIEQAKVNAEAEAYLASTDWLIIRELDSGVPCPEEIKTARQAARARIIR